MADLDPDAAREEAQRLLDDPRYQARDVPRPLRGVLRWIGERIEDVAGPVADLLATPGGTLAAIGTVAALTVLGVVVVARRRTRVAEAHERSTRRDRRTDPTALEREAAAAEAAGALDRAVRLRFRAGVLRLEQSGAIPTRPDATTRRLVAEVRSAAFPPLAAAFDEVAYGGRRAGSDDVRAAREGWPRVLADARSGSGEGGAA